MKSRFMAFGRWVELGEDRGMVTSLEFVRGCAGMEELLLSRLAEDAKRQILEYEGGILKEFSLPLKLEGTAFQMSVWESLRKVGYGEVVSYSELAGMAGRPRAVRAAASACAANRIPIFVPCHRVVRSDGSLGGFSCGAELKVLLLNLEGQKNFGLKGI